MKRFIFMIAVVLLPHTGWAQGPDEADESYDSLASAPDQKRARRAIARGFFTEGRVGGGYMVSNKGGKFGGGSLIEMTAGYDINDLIAIVAVGGGVLASGIDENSGVDLSLFYVGGGLRLSLPMTTRLNFNAMGAAAFSNADVGIAAAKQGLLIDAGLGFDYYVHIRHFSVGLDVKAVAPLDPARVFVAIAPYVRYTF